jgi:hypothetical protein
MLLGLPRCWFTLVLARAFGGCPVSRGFASACAAPSTAPFAAPAAAPARTLPSTFFALLMILGDDFDCRDRLPSPFLLAGREPDFLELDRFFAVLLAVVRFFVVFLVGIFPLFNMLTKTCNVDCLAPSPRRPKGFLCILGTHYPLVRNWISVECGPRTERRHTPPPLRLDKTRRRHGWSSKNSATHHNLITDSYSCCYSRFGCCY